MDPPPLSWAYTVFIFCFLLLPITSQIAGPKAPRNEVIRVRNGAVATDDRRCSRIGKDVLLEGGNAVDASVAAALCLGVVSPASSGIGGGAFMLVRLNSGKTQAFDMRETAPSFASENMYEGNVASKSSGALSIAVPGELAGLHEAWRQHGKLPWKRLVSPAERLARNGFKISPYLHMQMMATKDGILADRGLRGIFTSDGNLLGVGDVCHNKKLAETLKKISEFGPGPLYNGSIGFNLVRDIKKFGGIISMDDLRRYRVRSREPTSASVLGLEILGMPPPSSGGAAMTLVLNILSLFGSPLSISGSLGVHRMIEALKHAFAVRMNLGDPNFVNVSAVFSDMMSVKFAAELKKTIYDNMTFSPEHYGGRWNQIHDHGTSHISVIDRDRNVVSMTSTVNSYFGARVLSQSTGILLNNEMDDFSIPGNVSSNVPPPAPANFIRPGKRPLSSMSPTIILKDGQLKAAIGASGGGMIIAGTTEVLLNHFAAGMDPLSSVMAPRFYHQLIPNVVYYENWTTVSGDHFEFPEATRAALRKKGHLLQSLSGGTICQFVVLESGTEEKASNSSVRGVTNGVLAAVSDPRKGIYGDWRGFGIPYKIIRNKAIPSGIATKY